MAAITLLQEVFEKMTGTTPPTTGDFWTPAASDSDFAGYNIIYSGDRITEALPDRAYPFILMELGSKTKTERKGFKMAELFFSIGLFNTNDGTLDEIDRIATVLNEWLDQTPFVNALKCYPESIVFSIGERRGKYIGTRFADITVKAMVEESW